MREIDIESLSGRYRVRRLDSDDLDLLCGFCAGHDVFERYSGAAFTRESLGQDLRVTPPGIPPAQKYYIGFFEKDELIAVMDLIDGYPAADEAFIGFFMVNTDFEGKGIGSRVVAEALDHLKCQGFTACRLGINRGNPQSTHFWKKNGFEIEREAAQEQGVILVAVKKL